LKRVEGKSGEKKRGSGKGGFPDNRTPRRSTRANCPAQKTDSNLGVGERWAGHPLQKKRTGRGDNILSQWKDKTLWGQNGRILFAFEEGGKRGGRRKLLIPIRSACLGG